MEDLDQCPRCGLAEAWRGDASGKCVTCYWPDAQVLVTPDPRDAEIARLKAEVGRLREYERIHGVRSNEIGKLRVDLAAHKRALAAGPAALHYRSCDCCSIVERAQSEAMKEEP